MNHLLFITVKKDAGKNPENFINPHSQKHLYNESTKFDADLTRYGKHINVKKLVEDTKNHPDSIEYKYQDPSKGKKV